MPIPTPYFFYNKMVAKLRDGRLIAKGVTKQLASAGCIAIIVRVPDLREIEEIIEVEFNLTGFNCTTEYIIGPEMNKKIVGNLVGFSLYVVTAGASLETTVLAIGPP